jgi:hypothetical protein
MIFFSFWGGSHGCFPREGPEEIRGHRRLNSLSIISGIRGLQPRLRVEARSGNSDPAFTTQPKLVEIKIRVKGFFQGFKIFFHWHDFFPTGPSSWNLVNISLHAERLWVKPETAVQENSFAMICHRSSGSQASRAERKKSPSEFFRL